MIYFYIAEKKISLYADYIYEQKGPKRYEVSDENGEFKSSLLLNKGTVTKQVKDIKDIQKEFWKRIDECISENKTIEEIYSVYKEMFYKLSTSDCKSNPTTFEQFKDSLLKQKKKI